MGVVLGGRAGNGYLSFVTKCVSNPVSCVALGESDLSVAP